MAIGKPTAQHSPDITALIDACSEYVEWLDSDDYHEDGSGNYENVIFEQAMFAIFGTEVFEWINKRMES